MATDDKGWYDESDRHREAAEGKNTSASKDNNGPGWHNNSKGHAKAARGEDVKPKGIMDKLTGK